MQVRGLFRRFFGNRSGNVAMTFAFALPAVAGSAVIAVELAQATNAKQKLQALADSSAIAAARELRLGNARKDAVLAVAKAHVDAGAASTGLQVQFGGDIPDKKNFITVNLTAQMPQVLGAAIGLIPTSVSVTSRARVMGGAPVCAVALETSKASAIDLDKQARMEARQCAVYSNSTNSGSIKAKKDAVLTAAFICAAGGKGGGVTNFSPTPETDCPALPDPLAKRPKPAVGACDSSRTNVVLDGGSATLTPGVYCGGLKITGGADVQLSSGVYIIKDGELVVDGGGRIAGQNVGFFFTGKNATMNLAKDSRISLTAPKTGPLAGILFRQDTNVTGNMKYEISSDDASVLLGTIYLPTARFYAGGQKPVAQNSAYTIVVAREIHLSAGPTMVLNSNYSATDIPVPDGVGPLSQSVTLDK